MRTIQSYWDHQAYPVISDVHEMSSYAEIFIIVLKNKLYFMLLSNSFMKENVTCIKKIVETFIQFHF